MKYYNEPKDKTVTSAQKSNIAILIQADNET